MASVFRRIADWAVGKPAPLVRTKAPRDRRRWPDWISNGLTIERMAAILRNADQGDMQDMMSLLQEVATRDPLLNGLLAVRLSALSQRPIKVNANKQSQDPELAQEIAAFGQRIIDGLRLARPEGDEIVFFGGNQSVVESILLASYYGVSFGWVHWSDRESTPIPIAIEFLDQRRFNLDLPTDVLQIVTQDNSVGVPACDFPDFNYLETRNNRISNRVPMMGFGRSILLSWWLRFGTLKDLTNYVETWGRPGLVITANQNDGAGYGEAQYEELQNFLEDYLGDTRVLLPPGFTAELLEAQTGGEKIFQTVDSLTERHIQFAAVGQVGAISGDVATYAAGAQAQKVRDDLTDGDARLVGESLEKLLRYAVSLRYGADAPMPSVEFEVEKSIQTIRERALAMQAASYPLGSMLKSGIPVDIREYCELMGIPLRADGHMDPQYFANIKAMTELGVTSSDPQQMTRQIDTGLQAFTRVS